MESQSEQLLQDVYDLKTLLGNKWSPAIMVALANGPMRRSDLFSTVSAYAADMRHARKPLTLHDSILTRELRNLVQRGILERASAGKTFPPMVTYALKPEVLDFLRLSGELSSWLRQHTSLVAPAAGK
jgi:DNA-binding HxlR family transcriptional regulator